MTGEQGVKAVEITKPRTAIPIHYNDFSVFLSGLDDFKKAAQHLDREDGVRLPRSWRDLQIQVQCVNIAHRRTAVGTDDLCRSHALGRRAGDQIPECAVADRIRLH